MQMLAFHTVDVFTTQPFSGNPLSIVLDADALSDKQMQLMAREFNLPETIFVQTPDNPDNDAKVRIFTPASELPFAGHPTIGCAIFLAQRQQTKNSSSDFKATVNLEEQAGLVPVEVEREQGNIRAQLTAPVIPTPANIADTDSAVILDRPTAAKTLGIDVTHITDSESATMAHTGGPTFLFISLNNRDVLSDVRALEPFATQLSVAYSATGLYVYYLDTDTNEVDARMFAPAAGIPEDPATGATTALLASQLKCAQQLSEGNNKFTLRQGYDMGRPSNLDLEIQFENDEIMSVKVAGSSVAMGSGRMRVPETEA